MPRHRRPGPAFTRPHRVRFRPRHCAGTDCLHDHPGDRRPAWRVFPLLRSVTA